MKSVELQSNKVRTSGRKAGGNKGKKRSVSESGDENLGDCQREEPSRHVLRSGGKYRNRTVNARDRVHSRGPSGH